MPMPPAPSPSPAPTTPRPGRLAGRNCLIVGGTSGIGLASARRFLEEGARLVVTGRTAEALGQLRWALAVGEKPTGIVYALASGVRAIGRVATADRSMRPADLPRELGMPPWKFDRVRQQMGRWSGDAVARALQAIAEADAAVKGGGSDPAYALEQCVVTVSQAARGQQQRP